MADKILRVCKSSELPILEDRLENYMYFTYDDLMLYSGKNTILENFVIAGSVPEEPVPGLIYILNTDGSAHRVIDYIDTVIAEIEDSAQIAILEKAGTVFYINSANRYYDPQNRGMVLPFNNGNFELVTSIRKDQSFNNDTILKYSEELDRFKIYGSSSEEYTDFTKQFVGGETNSVKMDVDETRLKARIKLSAKADNILKIISDGLLAMTNDKVDYNTYKKWADDIGRFNTYANDLLDNIQEQIKDIEVIISEETVKEKILEELEVRIPDIMYYLSNYAAIATRIDDVETTAIALATTAAATITAEIRNRYNSDANWTDLDPDLPSFRQQIDYYEIANKYLYPEINDDELKAIFIAAIQSYMNDTTE